ncbi:hypothetical protein ILYODFUR_010236 [Ilyodon furcidens]|uniref:Uncharacterized protein n=1 Tax=Ilyodon furcidens TaxID=33524 RepID=A0ABV0TW63_9TELE
MKIFCIKTFVVLAPVFQPVSVVFFFRTDSLADMMSSVLGHTACLFVSVALAVSFRLAVLWGHSLLVLFFGCRGGRGGRGRGRGGTPSGLHARARHLELASFCERSVVDAFQKKALSLAPVKSLV